MAPSLHHPGLPRHRRAGACVSSCLPSKNPTTPSQHQPQTPLPPTHNRASSPTAWAGRAWRAPARWAGPCCATGRRAARRWGWATWWGRRGSWEKCPPTLRWRWRCVSACACVVMGWCWGGLTPAHIVHTHARLRLPGAPHHVGAGTAAARHLRRAGRRRDPPRSNGL